ncbi:MAG: hypothetical protein SOS98_02075 [Varibaculum sp.]|nr:hypothetical protein [Varibaculum sp.]
MFSARARLTAIDWDAYARLRSFRGLPGRFEYRRTRHRRHLCDLRILPNIAFKSARVVALTGLASLVGRKQVALPSVPLLPSDPQEAPPINCFAARSQELAGEIVEDLQRAYFTAPWLGDLTITTLDRIGGLARIIDGITAGAGTFFGGDGRRNLPDDSTDAFWYMVEMFGYASGYFRAGRIHLQPIFADGRLVDNTTAIHRFSAPADLSEALLDIDDMYYSTGLGAPVKVVRVGDASGLLSKGVQRARVQLGRLVGEGLDRLSEGIGTLEGSARAAEFSEQLAREAPAPPRWIVLLPGTDHFNFSTTSNPADPQTNLREIRGSRSAMGAGVNRVIAEAMRAAGVTDLSAEKVLMVGHSQGAMVAMNLAADPEVPYRIEGVVSAGGPIGRYPVPDGIPVLALRHRQDMMPLFGGTLGERDPRIAVFERSLAAPESAMLYYSHMSSTYAETAKLAAEYASFASASKVAAALREIESFFPRKGGLLSEPTRVFVYQIVQEVRQ